MPPPRDLALSGGALYVVSTPIGNLEDISARALRLLREADLIAAEDTRHTRRLLRHYQIRTPLLSYHGHNEHRVAPELARRVAAGQKVALVADSGTPGLSDPGYLLIHAVVQAGCLVVSVPGATAAVAALTASGFPMDRFVFEGFLPARSGKRARRLEALSREARTVVLFISPHRLEKTLEELSPVLAVRPVALAREMTKIHEEVLRGTCEEVLAAVRERGEVKGEITLVIHGAPGREEEGW